MGKIKISLIIIGLLIVSAFLIVNIMSIDSSEPVPLSNQIMSNPANARSQPIKPESRGATIQTKLHETDDKDTMDESVNGLNQKLPSSGLDIMTNQEQLAEDFKNEEKGYHWSGYWENELQTIVLFVGAKAFVESSEVECKSSTCAVTVNLSVNTPQNTVMALEALSEEFAQRKIKLVPESIDPANGEVIFYTQPGDIPE